MVNVNTYMSCPTEEFKVPEEMVKAVQFGFLDNKKPSWLTSTNDLRYFQKECIHKFEKKMWSDSDDPLKNRFVITATPASGKTIAAILLAYLAFERKFAKRVIIVTPGSVVRDNWGSESANYGIEIKNKPTREIMNPLLDGFHGRATTYQQLASMKPHQVATLRREIETVPTLVICDEIHHASLENSWGIRLEEIFKEHAKCVVLLSGTPYRTDKQPLPFLGDHYDIKDVTDVEYTYIQGMRDGYLRKIRYQTQDGIFKWDQGDSSYSYVDMENGNRISRYTKVSDSFKHVYTQSRVPKRLKRQRYNFAISTNPECNAVSTKMISQGIKQLQILRRKYTRAQGLIVVESTVAARFAQEIFRVEKMKSMVTKNWRADIAVSANGGTDKIKTFKERALDHPFIIAIKQVSEGVDIPNLAVCVYLSNITTKMFIIQVLGRILRMSKDEGMKNLNECWFISPREDIIDEYVGSMAASVHELTSELVAPFEEELPSEENTADYGDETTAVVADISDSETKDESAEPVTNVAGAANQSTIRHIEDSFQTERDPDLWRLARETAERTNGLAEEWYAQMISNRGVQQMPTPVIYQPLVQPSLNDRMLALRKDIGKAVNSLNTLAIRYGVSSDWSRGRIWVHVKGRTSPLEEFTLPELEHMRAENIPRISTLIKKARTRPTSNISSWVRKKPKNDL